MHQKHNQIFQKEKDFQTKLNKCLKQKGAWVYKIPDTGFAYKPFDVMIRTHNWALAIELKLIKWTTRTDALNKLRPHQAANLSHIAQLGWKALLLVFYAKENIYKLYDFTHQKWKSFAELAQVCDYLLSIS